MATACCYSCKRVRELVYADAHGLHYCEQCVADLPMSSVSRAMRFLTATIPYRPGDRVECRTAGVILDGVGEVDGISFDLEEGGGTPVTPVFHVTIDAPAYPDAPREAYYPEICLKKVSE